MIELTEAEQERFWAKVQPTGFCWYWTGSLGGVTSGYGRFGVRRLRNAPFPAHRISYELLVGEIPEALVMDHHFCRNPPCVNPDHLEPVTVRENALRAPVRGKPKYKWRPEMCAKGLHRMDEHHKINGRYRLCRPCRKEYMRAYGASRVVSP